MIVIISSILIVYNVNLTGFRYRLMVLILWTFMHAGNKVHIYSEE